jgi:hypothetical protein
MMVSSETLAEGAATIRKRRRPMRLAECDVRATAAQLDTAAQILRDAAPSYIRGQKPEERPGFIEPTDQDDSGDLVFRMGVIGSTYRIDRRGNATEVR